MAKKTATFTFILCLGIAIGIIVSRVFSGKIDVIEIPALRVVNEYPTLHLSSLGTDTVWKLLLADKIVANSQEEAITQLKKYSEWARKFDEKWFILINPSEDITIKQLQDVIQVLHQNGYDRFWINKIIYGAYHE